MYKLAFIGSGNMAGAIYTGICSSGLYRAKDIALCDTNQDKLRSYEDQGCGIFSSAAEAAKQSETLLFSIKPQIFPQVLPLLKNVIPPHTLVISIAAGISIAYIKRMLDFDAKVVRVMPNACMLAGMGATALAYAPPVTETEFAKARSIFDCGGVTAVIPEDKMDEIIPINGSSPAYLIRFAQIFTQEAEKAGIPFETAHALFAQTLKGTAEMLLNSGKSHQELIDMVTSPGGTTFAGLNALAENGFAETLSACFVATVRRSRELGKL